MYCTMKRGSVSEKKCNNITLFYRVKIQPAMYKKVYDCKFLKIDFNFERSL